jgi:septum formation inhibitor MinC
MLIIGYKGNIDWSRVRAAFKKCTAMTPQEIEKIIKSIRSGQSIIIPEDFVLHDELKELGILVN